MSSAYRSIVVGMADGFAQTTRNAAFINLHSAAGLGHALGNVFTAYKNQTPLVIAPDSRRAPCCRTSRFCMLATRPSFPVLT